MKKKVIIAMSGGVDSSAAACLLVKEGYEVIGMTMRLPYTGVSSDLGCCGIKGIEDARSVAQKIGIPFYAVNYEQEFNRQVVEPFCKEYQDGRTPNPCVLCNERMKFGALLAKAHELDASYVATGHYARIEHTTPAGRYVLKKGRDISKDQSYFLFTLTQQQLSRSLFPLGKYTKQEVRSIARDCGLAVHDKPASQEICFIPDNDYRGFLERHGYTAQEKEGPIVTTSGKSAGTHAGISGYTIGQRKGIGAHTKPMYVVGIDKPRNTVVIGSDAELYRDTLIAEKVNWIAIDELREPLPVQARIRFKHPGADAMLYPEKNNRVRVVFSEPQRAITPGQAVVFYDAETVVGGGWIV